MVGGEIHKPAPIGGRRTILNAALVLANRDQLLRSSATNCFPHGADPIREDILGEEIIVVDFQRIVADIHAARRKIDVFGERDRPLYLR